MLKAVILIGGPQKGTRFRPLSFEVPKPLFPVAGVPMIQHHIEACAQVPGMQEILLIGFYQPDEPLTQFLEAAQQEFNLPVRYLQEFAPLGTGGGLYHFRDQILAGGPEAFFVLNADVCSDFPLNAMLAAHRQDRHPFLLLGTTANRTQSLNYGCIVENPQTHEVLHYVEKPSTFISDIINCGIYLFSPDALKPLRDVFQRNQQDGQLEDSPGLWPGAGTIRLEQDVFSALAGQGQIYVYLTDGIWSQIKSAGSALYASRLYLGRYEFTHPERLAKHTPGGPQIRGNVYIHPTAKVAPSAVVSSGPSPGVKTGGGQDGWVPQVSLLYHSLRYGLEQIDHFPLICSRKELDWGSTNLSKAYSTCSSSQLGPNVSIGKGVTVGEGVRLRESIVLHGATLQEHTCVLHSIVGWGSTVGRWARVEGTPNDPNPNDPRARMDSESLFKDGKLLPAITILGCRVRIPAEVLILNSIVLPHKELSRSFTNQIIL
ncbi:mannose-1-phosphate guanyltransferase alpha isoform X2 [Otolemur garnettii]|uniref:mannose-1-phosphate guanyltransferase alpha isoform X2 n=1 Tax=Otolemur garnettii TaxID=30611 RepID=UPI000C7EFEE7|nr:mannose-1-phosphate guanyltransferase alpha isoform X2 [Otolemur garnettii]